MLILKYPTNKMYIHSTSICNSKTNFVANHIITGVIDSNFVSIKVNET